MYADVLDMFQVGSVAAQISGAAEGAAVDVPQKVDVLRSQLQGYALAQATPNQLKDEPMGEVQSNSVLQRCIVDGINASKRFHVQRGLLRLGYEKGIDVGNLRIHMTEDQSIATKAIEKVRFKREEFKAAYKWAQCFNAGICESLDRRFDDRDAWQALKKLVDPETWRGDVIPKAHLRSIAARCSEQPSVLEEEWVAARAAVRGRMQSEMTPVSFRRQALLPGLASRPKPERGALTRMLVLGAMTVGNSAQLERDMKSIREVFDHRTRKLDPAKVGMQCRLALNFKHRSLDQYVQALVDRWRQECHETDKRRRKERTDKGGTHRKRRRILPGHLTDKNLECLHAELVEAVTALDSGSDREDNVGQNPVGVLSHEFLSG